MVIHRNSFVNMSFSRDPSDRTEQSVVRQKYTSLQSTRLAQDLSGVAPAGLNAVTSAGPWQLTLSQFVRGGDALVQILAASDQNFEPADGVEYLLVSVKATNSGSAPRQIDYDDFSFFGAAGVVRRSFGLVPPSPALMGAVDPGSSLEGWVVGAVESGDENPRALFDSRSLGGDWADRLFNLTSQSQVAGPANPASAVNEAGTSPASPAKVGEPIATAGWIIELQQALFGQDVYDLFPSSDYRTTAVGDAAPEFIPNWVALQLKITNNRTGAVVDHLPATAFGLSWADGSLVLDVPLLTPPAPDASGDYFAGGSRLGWVAFERPATYGGSLVRFQPYRIDQDVRYLTWGDGAAPSGPAAAEPTPAPPDEKIPEGSTVSVTESDVNLRGEPGTQGEIVAVLEKGTQLTVTGEPVEADDLTWYPVQNSATGESGFVAANFLRPEP
jgi:Bacterial SH3 domain